MLNMKSLACTSWFTCAAFLLVLGSARSNGQNVPQVAGYLSRVPTANLRFAPPPKPPVAQLALSGIRADPSPFLNASFLNDKSVLTNRPIDLRFLEPQTLKRPDPMAAKPLANAVVAPDLEVLSPQALLRFFESKPHVAGTNSRAIPAFQLPIKVSGQATPAAKRASN